MLNKIFLILFTVLAMTCVASADEYPADAPGKAVTYCGELGLGISVDEYEFVTNFYLLNSGGPFKIVHGIIIPEPTPDDPDFKPILFSGTGQVVDMMVDYEIHPVFFASGVMSQEHFPDVDNFSCWMDGRVWQFSLDLSTIPATGSIWNVGVDYNECAGGGDPFDQCYGRHSISVVGELPKCLSKYVQ